MFWCIICDGYEAIGKRIVVLGSGTKAADLASELLNFTPDVTLVSWDGPFRNTPERQQTMAEHGITIHDARCVDFVCANTGYLCNIILDNGVELGVDMLFVAQRIEPKSQLAKLFNISVDENGFIVADSEQSTNIEGVFAAGDVSHMFNHQVTTAVHEGGMAAAAANHYLYADWQKE